MRYKVYCVAFLFLIVGCLSGWPASLSKSVAPEVKATSLMAVSLCDKQEKVVFSCAIRRSGKIVSLCSSPKLNKIEGYLQYRFGQPGRIELEFPRDRAESRKVFKYSHYFRAQVDYTEVSFSNDGYTYSVFDDYNGEEKPAVSAVGLNVTSESSKKEVKYLCQGKPTADYGDLPDTFENSYWQD